MKLPLLLWAGGICPRSYADFALLNGSDTGRTISLTELVLSPWTGKPLSFKQMLTKFSLPQATPYSCEHVSNTSGAMSGTSSAALCRYRAVHARTLRTTVSLEAEISIRPPAVLGI